MDGPLTDFPADFTFSESELQDVLVFMERQQLGAPSDPTTASLPFLNPPNPGSVGLQFQPHTYSTESTTQPVLPAADPLNFLPEEADTRSISSDPSPLREAPSMEEPTARSDDADFIPPGVKQDIPGSSSKWELRQQNQGLPLHAAMHNTSLHSSGSGGNLRKADIKSGQVSHSTVEKQRRDRINSLIDELRDLVPPQTGLVSTTDKDDSKRPKHVVLSDTIALVKELQIRANLTDAPPHQLPAAAPGRHNARDLMQRTYPQRNISSSRHHHTSSVQELPLAPTRANVAVGVKVEPGKGCLYVKVHWADRRGLLSDIIAALKSMPLEITTAAVTTDGGYVHNVFQVHLETGARLLPQDIQQKVTGALHGSALADKRRRVMA